MNWYMAIPSEYGVFKTIKTDSDQKMNTMEKEDKIFKSKNVQLSSVDINELLLNFHKKLSEKLSTISI